MEWLVSEMLSIIVDSGKTSFKGFRGKIRLHNIKKKLKKNLFSEILNKYGEEVFYNDLDIFLSTNKVIYNIIKNCENSSIPKYKPKSEMINYYIQLFLEKHLEYKRYTVDIKSLINNCFDVIYNTLNASNDENVRIIANISKELAGELSNELKDVKHYLKENAEKIDELSKKINIKNTEKIEINKYYEYLSRIYIKTTSSNFIERSLYSQDKHDKDIDSLEALLEHKQILLLGEAGYGKTYESLDLLNKVCNYPNSKELIPFYIPLYEYGNLYSSLIKGIYYQVDPYCNGNPENLIKEFLLNGNVVFILDGIDDIKTLELRNKFIAESKNLMLKYDQCYFFITSRLNRYNDELENMKHFNLKSLNREMILKQLYEENIFIDIPDNYFELFGNPMFLNIGKKVLKKSKHREIFNRSILFEEIFIMLSGEWEKKKGVFKTKKLSYSDTIKILSKYAFDTFDSPYTKILEFDEYISKHTDHIDKPTLISNLLESEVLKVTDKITFSHKLFKEYCSAYRLVNKYPLSVFVK